MENIMFSITLIKHIIPFLYKYFNRILYILLNEREKLASCTKVTFTVNLFQF